MINGTTRSISRIPSLPARPPLAAEPAASARYTRILVPTGLTRGDCLGATLALGMAAACRGKVIFLRVLAPQEPPNSAHWLDAIDSLHRAFVRPPVPDIDAVERARGEIYEFLEREVPGYSVGSEQVTAECRVGETADVIARVAEERDVDLVLLHSARPAWGLPILPREVRRVLQLTRRPVLLVHADAGGSARLSAAGGTLAAG